MPDLLWCRSGFLEGSREVALYRPSHMYAFLFSCVLLTFTCRPARGSAPVAIAGRRLVRETSREALEGTDDTNQSHACQQGNNEFERCTISRARAKSHARRERQQQANRQER